MKDAQDKESLSRVRDVVSSIVDELSLRSLGWDVQLDGGCMSAPLESDLCWR